MISQYANSPKYVKLHNGLLKIFNDGDAITNFYNTVVNISTAKGFGLDIWGSIIGQGRSFSYEGTTYYLKGEQTIDGIHYTSDEMDEKYRLVLKLKALSNISNFSIASINNLLSVLFSDKTEKAYCLEVPDDNPDNPRTGTMTIRFVFRFFADKITKAIIETLAPHPTGVGISGFEYLPAGEYFGFFTPNKTATEQPWTPLDKGPFYKYYKQGE